MWLYMIKCEVLPACAILKLGKVDSKVRLNQATKKDKYLAK